MNDFPNDLKFSTSGVMSQGNLQQQTFQNKNNALIQPQQQLRQRQSEAGMSLKNFQLVQTNQVQKGSGVQSIDTRDPILKYGSYLETKSSKFFNKDQYGRVARRDSRQSAKSQNSANEFSFVDNPQGQNFINEQGSTLSHNQAKNNGQSPYFINQGKAMPIQQYLNQEKSTPIVAKTLSGQDTIEDNQELAHQDIGQQKQSFIQHLQISSTSTQQQKDVPLPQQQKNLQNIKGKGQSVKSREKFAVNVLLLDGNSPKDGRLQLQNEQTGQDTSQLHGSGARTNENQKRQMTMTQTSKFQPQKPFPHKLSVVVQNPSIQQETASPQTDNMNFTSFHHKKKGQDQIDSEVQSEQQKVENQEKRDMILLKQFNQQVITEQIQKQDNNENIMKSFDDIDSAFIRNKDHLKFLGQTENVLIKSNQEDDIVLQPLSNNPKVQYNTAQSSQNQNPFRVDSELSNIKNTQSKDNKESSNNDVSPYQKNENSMPPQNSAQKNVTRVNTLLLNAPSDANLLNRQSPRSGYTKPSAKGSSKFIIQSSMNKSKRWLQANQKQQSELIEESKSSFQDMVLKGYNNESPINEYDKKQTEYFDINFDHSSQVNVTRGSRNFARKTYDQRETKYADLVRKFISRSPKYGGRNQSNEQAKSRMGRYESQGKITSQTTPKKLVEKVSSTDNQTKPKQVEKIIQNSYKPLDTSSQIQKMISRSKERNKSYYHKLQEQKRISYCQNRNKSKNGSKIGRIEFGDIQPFDQAPQIIVQDQEFNLYRGDQGRKTASNFSRRPKLISREQSNRYNEQISNDLNPYNDPELHQSPSSLQDQLYSSKPFSADASKFANLLSTSHNSFNFNNRISSKDLQQITETVQNHFINELDSGVHLLQNQIELTKNSKINFGAKTKKDFKIGDSQLGDGVSALTEYEQMLSSVLRDGSMLSSQKDLWSKDGVAKSVDRKEKISFMSGSKLVKNPLLGVMYQNVNRVLSIGDIDGVKGDPAENIREKGIFEQQSPFQLQKSHIQQKECSSLKLMKIRRQCCYADGAIQYNKNNTHRDDKCLDESHDHSKKLNQNKQEMLNVESRSVISKRRMLDQNSGMYRTSFGNQGFMQDGFSSRQSEDLNFQQPSSTPASQSIQKMKHLRRLKNKQTQFLQTKQAIKRRSTAALILQDHQRYEIDRGQAVYQDIYQEEAQIKQLQNPSQKSYSTFQKKEDHFIQVEESMVESKSSLTKELLVAQTIDQPNQVITPKSGSVKGDHLHQVRGYQSSLPQQEIGHFSNEKSPFLKVEMNEKSEQSQVEFNLKIKNQQVSKDTNLERESSEVTQSKNSETARLIKQVKEGNQIREMPTPMLETQNNYWMNQHNIHLQQIEQEKLSIFTHSKNFDFFKSPASHNNQNQQTEQKSKKKPVYSQTSYMGFKIPDLGQQQKISKLRTLIKTANGQSTTSAKSINIETLQKQTTKTSHQNVRKLRKRRNDQSQGSNIYSSLNQNSSQELKMKHGTGSAVSFASRPSTIHNYQQNQKSNSIKNLRKRESFENKIKQIQKSSNLNFRKQNASILKSQAEKDHFEYLTKQIESITMMSSDALNNQANGQQNIIQVMCQAPLYQNQEKQSQVSEVKPGSYISKDIQVNIGISSSMGSFGSPKFKATSQHQNSKRVDERQIQDSSYKPYDDSQNLKFAQYSVNTGDRIFKKIELDNQGPPTQMNLADVSTYTPQPNVNTTKLSEKQTLINSSIVGSNEPVSASENSPNVKIQDQQSTMVAIRQVNTDQQVHFIDINQNESNVDDQDIKETDHREMTVQTTELDPVMAKSFSNTKALETQQSVLKAQNIIVNCSSKDEELKLNTEPSQDSFQKGQKVINEDLREEGIKTPAI